MEASLDHTVGFHIKRKKGRKKERKIKEGKKYIKKREERREGRRERKGHTSGICLLLYQPNLC